MDEFINSFGRNNLIVIVSVIFAIIFALLIIVLIEKIRGKKNDEEYFNDDKEVIARKIAKPKKNDVVLEKEEKIDIKNKLAQEDKKVVNQEVKPDIFYAREETREDAKQAIEDITKKLIEKEENDNLITHTSFESEQEEKSVISYEELLKASSNVDKSNDDLLKDEGSEPITIEELYKEHLKQNEDKEVLDNPIFVEEKKFKNSELISPVFGIYSNNNSFSKKTNEEYLERTMDLEDLELEIKKTEEFLRELKKLKNKLD